MEKLTFVVVLCCFALASCVNEPTSAMTPLQIQSIQSREYEQGKDVVFPSVMSVFQDLGYMVASADKDTGLIAADGAASSSGFAKLFDVNLVSQTRATAFIEEIGDRTRVRLNFVRIHKESSTYGQSDRRDEPILDANVYQNAFERVENAIFVRSAN